MQSVGREKTKHVTPADWNTGIRKDKRRRTVVSLISLKDGGLFFCVESLFRSDNQSKGKNVRLVPFSVLFSILTCVGVNWSKWSASSALKRRSCDRIRRVNSYNGSESWVLKSGNEKLWFWAANDTSGWRLGMQRVKEGDVQLLIQMPLKRLHEMVEGGKIQMLVLWSEVGGKVGLFSVTEFPVNRVHVPLRLSISGPSILPLNFRLTAWCHYWSRTRPAAASSSKLLLHSFSISPFTESTRDESILIWVSVSCSEREKQQHRTANELSSCPTLTTWAIYTKSESTGSV